MAAMRSLQIVFILIGLLLASSCASTPPAIGDELVAVCRTQEAAWNRGDIEGYMAAGYSHSKDLTFLSGGSWTRGYDPVLARYKQRYTQGGAEMGHLDFADLESVALAPDCGMVRGRWRLTFRDGKQTGGLFTLLMRRTPEGWRIVHDHTSLGD